MLTSYFEKHGTSFKQEFLASIVVFLVALPLSLGIAMATGAPPITGIISAIIGGIIVGVFSGCPLQVSGAAAGLITIVAEIIHNFGFEKLGLIVFVAGIMQLIFAVLKLGPIFRGVAPSVIQGMLSAIGVIIVASQFHVMVGDSPGRDPIKNLLSIPPSLIHGLFPMDMSTYHISALLGVITITVILVWNMMPAHIKVLPPSLVGVVACVLIASLFKLPVRYLELPDSILDGLVFLSFPNLMASLNNDLYIAAFTVAFVASAETLLTATAVDKLHDGVRTKYNKEIFAQGMGNLVAGFLGVLPLSGVIVRSAANVNSNAKTRASTMMHGVLMLIFVIAIPHILEMIPTSSLAAILVYTGFKLINYRAVKRIFDYSIIEFVIYLVTVVAILATNLLEGIIIGLGVSLLRLAYQMNHLDIQVEERPNEKGVYEVDLEGAANFITLPKLAEALEAIEPKKKVHIFFDQCQYIDHSCMDFLISWEVQYIKQGGEVDLELHTLTDRFSKYKDTADKERKEQ